jgi:integrase
MKDGVEWRTDARGKRSYRGVLNTKAAGKRNGPWGAYAEARSWRSKALGEAEAGTLLRTNGTTLRAEAEAFLTGIENGSIRTRNGSVYKPATVRSYRVGWERVDPELGAHRLTAIRRADVQALVDRLAADPTLSDSTVRNTLDPLRAIYRRALRRNRVAINPTTDLDMPQSENRNERFADRDEAAGLIDAIRAEDRALWATAFYTGLRSGELRALRWTDVDLRAGLIHVRRGWDDYEGEQEPKSRAAKRRVPVIAPLLELLKAHQRITGRGRDDLVFGRTRSLPFKRETMRRRALRDWRDARIARSITLHEARHTAASLMIAAGANAKALSVVMGHESITITFDRYGHLMPGGESEVGRLLGEYIEGE